MSGAEHMKGQALTLDFNGYPVRAFMVQGVPWLALPDILAACGYNERGAEDVHKASFPAFGKMPARDAAVLGVPVGPADVVLLSPTGVYYWAQDLDPNRTTKLTAWARREARRLCSNPDPQDPSFYLQLVKEADGWTHVPPGPPSRYSGWKAEWEDLRDGDNQAWRAAQAANAEWNRKARMEREAQRLADEESGAVAKPLTLAEVLAPARAGLKRPRAASGAMPLAN